MSKLCLARPAFVLSAVLILSACDDGALDFLEGAPTGDEIADRSQPSVSRDVEAPEIFQTTEAGLWDGRPSLGGVWVAHPDVDEPRRVLIRNEANDNFVVGALFRRERETPGPRLQVSSDAAEELGMLAGEPVRLNVTALKRAEAAASDAPSEAEDTPPADAATPEEVQSEPLTDAPDAGEATATAAPRADAPPQPAPAESEGLARPFIQIGIFSVEQNARNTATSLRQDGIVPTVQKQTSSGKTFWRVIVGPATSSAERAAILDKVKTLGFADAFFVRN